MTTHSQGVFSEKLSAKEREEARAEPDYQLLTRLGHEFAPENSTLAVQKDKESTMQAVYQQLTELHRYLLAIQNAPVPGKSALKAVQLRLDQNSSDPIFATRQMAKTLPAPLNRWVGRLTDQGPACGDGGGCSLYGSGLARQRGETV